MEVKLINVLEHQEKVVPLLSQLNKDKSQKYLEETLRAMAELPNYRCFGFFSKGDLVGISSAWSSIRIYCGKQLELDNVIIDSKVQSKGFGSIFIDKIKEWSLANDYQVISLNTYVQNSRSHKFYYNQDFNVLGFHFQHQVKHLS